MFANQNHRLDFADTCAVSLETVLSLAGYGPNEGRDAGEQLAQAQAQADAADSQLLRTVMCAAVATLVLALVSSMA